MVTTLTSFRFITAFVVFLFHCQIHFGWITGLKVFDNFILNGATFMTGFFVLSGFIMAHVYNNTDFTSRNDIFHFYVKRFAKIYPTYIIATVIYFMFFGDYTSQQMLSVFVNDLFLVQGFFPSMFGVGINGGTWSLSVEAFLYFLFPFLILLSKKSSKLLIIAVCFEMLISLNVILKNNDYIYANPVYRLADFMCGIGFYFVKERFENIKFTPLLNFVILILLAFVCVQSVGSYQYMGFQFLIAPLFGAWITMVYYTKSKFYDNKITNYLGLISYSFYLWQFVAIELGKKLVADYNFMSIHMVMLLALTVNLAISVLSYHFIEEKARKSITNRFLSASVSSQKKLA